MVYIQDLLHVVAVLDLTVTVVPLLLNPAADPET
jgi:hypothetical protein